MITNYVIVLITKLYNLKELRDINFYGFYDFASCTQISTKNVKEYTRAATGSPHPVILTSVADLHNV